MTTLEVLYAVAMLLLVVTGVVLAMLKDRAECAESRIQR